MTTQADPTRPDASRYGVLVLLFIVYAFNFVDRQILGVLAHSIQGELHLTDTQLGWLGGPAFALFYTALGVPIAWLADRWSRTWIMTIALALWSAFTAACGFAGGFAQLFAARLGVGVGEAGGVAPAYSLISDFFPPKERARALAAYSFGIPVGSAAGVAIGGTVASLIDWRFAFIAVGAAGVLLAPLFRALMREPQRGRHDAGGGGKASASIWRVLGVVAAKPSFWLISTGAGSASIMGYGLFFWAPSFLIRSYAMTLPEMALYFASIVLIGGVIGIWLGGALADWLGTRSRAWFMLVPAAGLALAVPCYLLAISSPSKLVAFLAFLPPTAFGLAWLGPVLAAVQHLAPPQMRATASALFLFINNLLGLGLGPLAIGALSDALHQQYGAEALRYSILAGTSFYLLGAVLLSLASLFLARDWRD
jgi:MFS family permease